MAGLVLLVVATTGMTTTGLIALSGVSTQHKQLNRQFANVLMTAEHLRAGGEELLAVRRGMPSRVLLEPWLVHWTERMRVLLASFRERQLDQIGQEQVRDIERATEDCAKACLDSSDERARGAHDVLETTIARFVDRETMLFDRASSRVDAMAARYQLVIVLLTIAILATGMWLGTDALRRIDHLFLSEQAATATAQREAAARQEVLAVVSHDLRSPLSAIVLGSALLAETIPDSGGPRSPRRQVQVIRNAADRMAVMIDEILDTARIEAGTLTLHAAPCDVGEILDRTIEMFQLRAASKSITLRGEPPPTRVQVKADPERLLQILSNLMSNAVKFTPDGGEIVASAESKNDNVVFTIRDTGPGVPADQREHLFDRYWQAAESQQRGSLGLGLFICKSLVTAHGGTIWIEAPASGGSLFRFTIPRFVTEHGKEAQAGVDARLLPPTSPVTAEG